MALIGVRNQYQWVRYGLVVPINDWLSQDRTRACFIAIYQQQPWSVGWFSCGLLGCVMGLRYHFPRVNGLLNLPGTWQYDILYPTGNPIWKQPLVAAWWGGCIFETHCSNFMSYPQVAASDARFLRLGSLPRFLRTGLEGHSTRACAALHSWQGATGNCGDQALDGLCKTTVSHG